MRQRAGKILLSEGISGSESKALRPAGFTIRSVIIQCATSGRRQEMAR